jgi:hypothetical protein
MNLEDDPTGIFIEPKKMPKPVMLQVTKIP